MFSSFKSDSRSILLLLLVDLEVNEAKIKIFITNIYSFPGVSNTNGKTGIFTWNLIKLHLTENQFFRLKVIQLIPAYVGLCCEGASSIQSRVSWFFENLYFIKTLNELIFCEESWIYCFFKSWQLEKLFQIV